MDSDHTPPSFVAAMGASAGGLAALKSFFTALKGGNHISYFVIQHLDVHGKHLAQETISKLTSLTVRTAESGMLLEASKVYLVPPHSVVNINEGVLDVREAFDKAESHAVIDSSFRNLAHTLSHQVVGIIFSGRWIRWYARIKSNS